MRDCFLKFLSLTDGISEQNGDVGMGSQRQSAQIFVRLGLVYPLPTSWLSHASTHPRNCDSSDKNTRPTG